MMKSCNDKNNPYFKDKTWTSSEETEFTTKPIKTHCTDCLLLKVFWLFFVGCFCPAIFKGFILQLQRFLLFPFLISPSEDTQFRVGYVL